MAVLGPGLSAGDTAFMFLCTGMVQLMTPGLAFFYGGLVRSTHIITIMLQSYLSLGITFILWYVVLFSMSFGDTIGGVIGDPLQHFMFKNVTANKAFNEESATIPGVMFAGYQGMFAVIAPALMTGAFADRMRLPAYVAFKILWMFLVYAPVCHWVWGGGWMAQMGCYDFAGGIVVHITSAFSALASLNIVGNRHVPEDDLEVRLQRRFCPGLQGAGDHGDDEFPARWVGRYGGVDDHGHLAWQETRSRRSLCRCRRGPRYYYSGCWLCRHEWCLLDRDHGGGALLQMCALDP
mmetsp:Transcript_107912/g.344458  ORF Transcript_107912/g.344458 Transcript_107912/m.344458 type:complete len:293 (-) Transcript_107912:490-1368(-)